MKNFKFILFLISRSLLLIYSILICYTLSLDLHNTKIEENYIKNGLVCEVLDSQGKILFHFKPTTKNYYFSGLDHFIKVCDPNDVPINLKSYTIGMTN